jgi:hypothetical protein
LSGKGSVCKDSHQLDQMVRKKEGERIFAQYDNTWDC